MMLNSPQPCSKSSTKPSQKSVKITFGKICVYLSPKFAILDVATGSCYLIQKVFIVADEYEAS